MAFYFPQIRADKRSKQFLFSSSHFPASRFVHPNSSLDVLPCFHVVFASHFRILPCEQRDKIHISLMSKTVCQSLSGQKRLVGSADEAVMKMDNCWFLCWGLMDGEGIYMFDSCKWVDAFQCFDSKFRRWYSSELGFISLRSDAHSRQVTLVLIFTVKQSFQCT